MHILQLIEATLYRHQSSWESNDQPVLYIKGRAERKSSSSPTAYYAIAYGAEKLGVKCPRRWRSTFCTTDPSASSFFGEWNENEGIREIQIPPNTVVAACIDDYNYMPSVVDAMDHYELHDSLRNLGATEYGPEHDRATIVEKVGEAMRALLAIDIRVGSDDGYEQFVSMMTVLDQLAALIPDVIREEFDGASSFTELVIRDVKAAFGKDILLFNDASQIPEGQNYEVWFEGDYEAHLTKKAP